MHETSELAIRLHRQYQGKIAITLRDPGELTREKLGAYYSPGVGGAG
jgi:malic enzyme